MHDDLRGALAAQALHARMRRGQAHAGQQDREAVVAQPARRVHRPRVAAQQPAQCLEHAVIRRLAQLVHRCRHRIDLDEDQRELAVLACRQVHFAAQLIVEVCAAVEARHRVAQRLVLDLAAQLLVGALLLLELLQCRAQLRVALALCGLVEPDAAQPARAALACDAQAQHIELVPRALPFEAVLAGQRLTLGQCGLLGGAQGRGQRRIQQLGITAADHILRRAAQELGHVGADAQIAAGGRILHRPARAHALDQRCQQRIERAGCPVGQAELHQPCGRTRAGALGQVDHVNYVPTEEPVPPVHRSKTLL